MFTHHHPIKGITRRKEQIHKHKLMCCEGYFYKGIFKNDNALLSTQKNTPTLYKMGNE
jgi:hypothetical protein